MKKVLAAFLAGGLFGLGLAVSQMINPRRVQGFLDLASWDPTLMLVIIGAVSTTFVGYRLVWQRYKPLFDERFQVPTSRVIDAKLVGGSALFGIGWGIAGFCPGAAIPALGTGRWEVALFLAAVVAGLFLRRFVAPGAPAKASA